MKPTIVFFSLALLLIGIGLPAISASDSTNTTERAGQDPSWEIPIAAGVWYPTDGPVPDNPMRYYRIRCWPGCHTGSSYGKYPMKVLNDKPIFPTTAAGAHPVVPAGQE
jgi:hypothetical protein